MNNQPEVAILLVEDNARDAEMILRTLRKREMASHIVHVKDGQEALDFLFGSGAYAGRNTTHRPKLVLLDLKLPKLDGHEVLRAIRADERTRLQPVVIMTSSREERDVLGSYTHGVNSYVVKPTDFDRFTAAVAALGHYWLLINHEPT